MDDPYPIPLQNAAAMPRTSVTESDQYSDTEPHETDRPRNLNEDLDTYRARMVYQTRKRGTLETGLLLRVLAAVDCALTVQIDVDAAGADCYDGAPGAAGARAAHVGARVDAYVSVSDGFADSPVFYWMSGKQRPAEDSEWASSSLLGSYDRPRQR